MGSIQDIQSAGMGLLNDIIFENNNIIIKVPMLNSTTNYIKYSAKGLISVYEVDGEIVFEDECTREQEEQGLLTPVFKDGEIVKTTTIFEVRDKIWS